jgi:hypothetical protein
MTGTASILLVSANVVYRRPVSSEMGKQYSMKAGANWQSIWTWKPDLEVPKKRGLPSTSVERRNRFGSTNRTGRRERVDGRRKGARQVKHRSTADGEQPGESEIGAEALRSSRVDRVDVGLVRDSPEEPSFLVEGVKPGELDLSSLLAGHGRRRFLREPKTFGTANLRLSMPVFWWKRFLVECRSRRAVLRRDDSKRSPIFFGRAAIALGKSSQQADDLDSKDLFGGPQSPGRKLAVPALFSMIEPSSEGLLGRGRRRLAQCSNVAIAFPSPYGSG